MSDKSNTLRRSSSNFSPHGIIVPMITPFKGKRMNQIDHSALGKLTNFLIENGVQGLMPHGTSGEFLMQDREERAEVIRTVVKTCAGRVPVIAGISDSSTENVIKMGEDAVRAGADAVISTGPIYYRTTDSGLFEHFQTILDRLNLPLMIYNIPTWIGYEVSPELVNRLADKNPRRVIGVKFTTTDLGKFLPYLRLLKNKISIMIGADSLVFSALELGAAGSVVGGANVLPKEYSNIYEQFVRGNQAGSKEAQQMIDSFTIAMNLGTYPAAVKEGIRFLGLECGDVRPLLVPLDPEQVKRLRESLAWKKTSRSSDVSAGNQKVVA